jgi:hypothetical protein
MSLTIDELSPKFMLSKGVFRAIPARSDHTGLDPLCTTVFAQSLAACPSLALGRDARPRGRHSDGRLVGHGVGPRAPIYQLPSSLELVHVVSPPGRSDSIRIADHAADAPGHDDRL